MPMSNVLEYSQNYSVTSRSLWNYYRDEIDDADANASNGKPFRYKTKIIGKTEARPQRPPQPGPDDNGNPQPRLDQPRIPPLNTDDVVPLKYLSNFWRSLDLPLINCEIELDLKWTRNCVLIEDDNITDVRFTITSTKLYVPVVTLSINDNIEFLENIKQGFKRTISWNKYRSEITQQAKNNNLDYLIDPTIRNINKLFVLSFKNGENDPTMKSLYKYYMPLVEISSFLLLRSSKKSYLNFSLNSLIVTE